MDGKYLSGTNSPKKKDGLGLADPKEIDDLKLKRSTIKEQHDPSESTIRDKTTKLAAELQQTLSETDPRDGLIKTS